MAFEFADLSTNDVGFGNPSLCLVVCAKCPDVGPLGTWRLDVGSLMGVSLVSSLTVLAFAGTDYVGRVSVCLFPTEPRTYLR